MVTVYIGLAVATLAWRLWTTTWAQGWYADEHLGACSVLAWRNHGAEMVSVFNTPIPLLVRAGLSHLPGEYTPTPLRTLSALLGTIGLLAWTRAIQLLWGARAAGVYVALWTLSLVALTHEGLYATELGVGPCWAGLIVLALVTERRALATGFALAGFAIYGGIALAGSALIGVDILRDPRPWWSSRWIVLLVAVNVAAGVVRLQWWMLGGWPIGMGGGAYDPGGAWPAAQIILRDIFWRADSFDALISQQPWVDPVLWPLAALALTRGDRAWWLASAILLSTAAATCAGPYPGVRRAVLIAPGVFALAAVGWSLLWERSRPVALFAALCWGVWSGVLVTGHLRHWPQIPLQPLEHTCPR